MKRARKHADAVVVPTHALAERLQKVADFGDRVRVIGTAPRSGLVVGRRRAERAARLRLPVGYIAVPGTLEPRKGLVDVLAALGRPGVPDIGLVVLGPESWGDQHLPAVAEELGVDPRRVRTSTTSTPPTSRWCSWRPSAFVAPGHDDGSGTELIEAFSLGVPVIHSDTPALLEVSAGAGLTVPVGVGDGFADRLAAAISSVVPTAGSPSGSRSPAATAAARSAGATPAERVWQLHADL